ncbi:MAG: GUN4 domain-containing protein [Lyngbya sp.]|nr:GUN4 domain-containing protein [Lyngbya sp.]
MAESTNDDNGKFSGRNPIDDQPATVDKLGFKPYVKAMAEFLTHPDTKPPITISIEGEWGSGKSSFMKQLESEIQSQSEEWDREKLKQIERRIFGQDNRRWKLREIRRVSDFGDLLELATDQISYRLLNCWSFIRADLSDIGNYFKYKFQFNQKTQTVWFNAWRHDKSESIWATFALSFLEELSRNRDFSDWVPNLWSHFKLFLSRLNFKDKPLKTCQTIIIAFFIFLTITFIGWIFIGFVSEEKFTPLAQLLENSVNSVLTPEESDKSKTEKKSDKSEIEKSTSTKNESENRILEIFLIFGGGSASFAGIAKLLAILRDLIGDPKMDLTQYLQSPKYDDKVDFIEKFHQDFPKIVSAYAGKDEKVYVFIDDLDRCELGKTADLLQAFNLMISNDPNLVFILGMDREKVAAAITFKQKDILPFVASLNENNQEQEYSSERLRKQLNYGFSFMEKFVQLSFTVPKPSQNMESIDFLENLFPEKIERSKKSFLGNIFSYLSTLFTSYEEKNKKSNLEDVVKETSEENSSNKDSSIENFPNEDYKDLPIFPIIADNNLDRDKLKDIIRMVAPFFNYNPRRLKQYINKLRLETYIAYYSIGVKWKEKGAITTEQIGKFTAICLKYPLLFLEIKNSQQGEQLLSDLETEAVNNLNLNNETQNIENESNQISPEVANQSKILQELRNKTTEEKARFLINSDSKLADLLSYPQNKSQNGKIIIPEDYSLKGDKIKKLFEVQPELNLSHYYKLRSLLEEGKWREADEETYRVMLKVANREDEDWLNEDAIKNFPCKDLQIIDQLWVKYSEGKFGFSVQKEIYLKVGGNPDVKIPSDEVWYNFCDKVGWRQKNRWMNHDERLDIDDTSAIVGHLPTWMKITLKIKTLKKPKDTLNVHMFLLFSRAETCNL